MKENEIGTIVVDSAIRVHSALGPGLLEIVYEVSLGYELEQRGLKVSRQVPVGVEYGGVKFQEGFRIDLVVEDKVIVELKSVDKVSGVHKRQLQTYLKLAGRKLGYLLNFNVDLMKSGIVRCVNGLEE